MVLSKAQLGELSQKFCDLFCLLNTLRKREKTPGRRGFKKLSLVDSGLQKGPAEREKTSKIVEKCRKVFRHFFRHFSRRAKKKSKIWSKSVKNIFDSFRAGQKFSGPLFGGALISLVDVSDIFYFFCSGERKGEPEATGRVGGDRLFIENARREGGLRGERGRGCEGGREGVCREFGGIGGGAKYFFSGPKARQVSEFSKLLNYEFHA